MAPSVDRRTVDQMAGAVQAALWGPTGVAWRLPPAEQQMLRDTDVRVYDAPDARAMALVGDQVGNGTLMGLYTHPPSRIAVYASSAVALHMDPVDIATHELSHRFAYDHDLTRHAKVVLVANRSGEAHSLVSGSDCPVCLVEQRIGHVALLLDGLRQRWHLSGLRQVPIGLGGTIPQAARETAEARATLAIACGGGMLPDKQVECRELDQLLASLQTDLSRTITAEESTPLYSRAYLAWDKAYDLTHGYWVRQLYGAGATHRPQPDLTVLQGGMMRSAAMWGGRTVYSKSSLAG